MNEWLLAQWNRLRRKVDQMVIALLLVLLGAMFLFYWIEQQLPEPTVPPLPPVSTPAAPKDPNVIMSRFAHAKELRKVPEFRELLDFNMFDQRSVAVRSESLARLDKLFEKAQEAFLKNDLATAERICGDIINQMPSHRKSIELLKLISGKKKEQEKEPTKSP